MVMPSFFVEIRCHSCPGCCTGNCSLRMLRLVVTGSPGACKFFGNCQELPASVQFRFIEDLIQKMAQDPADERPWLQIQFFNQIGACNCQVLQRKSIVSINDLVYSFDHCLIVRPDMFGIMVHAQYICFTQFNQVIDVFFADTVDQPADCPI